MIDDAGQSDLPLAISNIAWLAVDEPAVADALQALKVRYVEIAPTKVFEDPTTTSPTERQDYVRFWADHNISLVAFQSMLFGRGDLQLFGNDAVRAETIDLLSRFIELAGAIEVGKLVFGSPKNRIVPSGMGATEANDIAIDFFRTLGQVAVDNNTMFCIEPNPSIYDCNFVTNAASGLELVKTVDHPGFKLHLDAAGMTLEGDPIARSIIAAGRYLAHFHASAPHLAALEDSVVDHRAAARALYGTRYDGFVSVEMRPGAAGTGPTNVAQAIRVARTQYASSQS